MKVKGTEKTNAEWLRCVVTENRQWSIVFHRGEVCSPISVEKQACDRGLYIESMDLQEEK